MPQIAHPTVIPGNRYYGGIFGQGGIGQAFLSPLIGAAAHALPEMLGMQSPEDEAKQLQVDAAKQAQGQKIYNDYLMGRTSKDEAQNILGKIGYDIETDKAALLPSAEDEMRGQAVKQAATASGYDLVNHRYGDMGFNSNVDTLVGKQDPTPADADVPDFEVKSSAPVTSGVAEKSATGAEPSGYEVMDQMSGAKPQMDVMGEMARATEKAPSFQPFPEPLGGDTNPVKVRPVDSFNLNELQQQGPQYFQQFFKPDDGQNFNYKGLSRQQQQQAQVIANRLQGFSNMMKMYDSKEITKPEDLAKVNSMIRTTEKDVNQMVDWHNETTTGDINKIRAMGGLPTLAMDMRSLQMLTPQYVATLPAAARPKVEERARQIANKLQQLNPFELKIVNQFSTQLGDESTKMLFDYQKEMARTGALNNQTNLGYYKTNVESADNQRELYQYKIPNMQLDAQTNFLKVHNDKIKNDIDAQKLAINANEVRLGYAKIAADLGIADKKSAVDYASMETSIRNTESNNRVQLMGQVMGAMTAEQKRNQDMIIKLHSGLGASKGLRERVMAATANTMSTDPAIRKEAEETLRGVARGDMDSASLISQKGVNWGGLLQSIGIPMPTGINPSESAGRTAQMGVSEMVTRADDLVNTYLKHGASVPVEVLNMRDHLKIDTNGDPMLDKAAYKTEEDTTVTGNGVTVPRDQKLVDLMVKQAQSFKTIPSYTEWLSWKSSNGIANSNIPEFKDQNRAKQFYNQMVDFHGRINGQRK